MPKVNAGPRLAQNPNGIWEIRWTENRRSKRKSTGTTLRSQAQKVFAEFLTRQPREQGTITVKALCERYLAEHVDENCADPGSAQRNLRLIIKAFGNWQVKDLPVTAINKYKTDRVSGKLSVNRQKVPVTEGTVRKELAMLIAAFNFGVRSRLIRAGDVPHVPLPPKSEPRDVWLTETELDQFLGAADSVGGRGRIVVYLCALTASRRTAVDTLTWGQVDLVNGLIYYDKAEKRRTKKRRVPVPISDRLRPVLVEYQTQATNQWVTGTNTRSSHHIDLVCEQAYHDTRNKKFLTVSAHTLRHTWATLAARRGVDIFEIAGVLGDSVSTVERNYLHHCPEHLRHAVNW